MSQSLAPSEFWPEGVKRIGFVIGTGPSLSAEQLALITEYRQFGCNNAYQVANLDVHLACNWQWWDHYHHDVSTYGCDMWTPRKESADKYPALRYIEERWEDGLSVDPSYICAHHGSGPQILNMALHYGCEVVCLLGFDMRYPGKITDREYTGPRHYFGEYPPHLQHWPRTDPDGSLRGLIKELETIDGAVYNLRIVNCTPESALECFETMSLSRFLSEYQNDLSVYKASRLKAS